MAGPSTSPPADEPYQWCIEGPRICNMDPDLMREFTAVVRCNRDGVAFPFTSDLESVMRQHQCTQEHGSKEDLETRKDGSFCSQSTAVFPQIPPITLQIDDGTGPRAPLNLQTLLDAAFAKAQSSHGRIDNRGTWLLKLDIIFMVKNPLGETLQLELVNGTSKVDKDPEERHSSNTPPLFFKFPKNAMEMENKQLEDSGMSDLASFYHGTGNHKKGKQLEEDEESSMRDEIIKLWTVTMDDKRAPSGGGDGGAGAGRGGHGDAGDGCGHGRAGDGCGHGGAGDGGPHGGTGDIYGGGHGSVGRGVGVVEEEEEDEDEETKGVVEGDEAGDSAGELMKHKREVEVLMEITQATCNEMVEEFKKISKMFNEFKKLAYGGAGGAVGDP